MKFIGKVKNGNYWKCIADDGTVIKFNQEDKLIPEYPDSFDYKITNKCNRGCAMCHENSKPDGLHGDIMNDKFIETLLPYTELAVGGGNPLEHPDLDKFLEKCKHLKLLILGYKEFRRGKELYKTDYTEIDRNKQELYDNLPELVKHFNVVSFDNLALKQLEPKRLLTDEEWNTYYAGEDGKHTLFIDSVAKTYSTSSTTPEEERKPFLDDIKPMFDDIRKINGN